MPRFSYIVIDPSGKMRRGQADGPGHLDVVMELKKVGYEVQSVWQQPPVMGSLGIWRMFQRVPLEELTLFTRQLSMFFGAGLGLLKGLDCLKQQGFSKKTSQAADDLSKSLRDGRGLSQSMALRPDVFSPVFTKLVYAGETSGALDDILKRLADYLERDLLLQKRLRSALAYPALIFAFSMSLVAFLVFFVFPMFVSFFDGLNLQLPLPTKSLIAVTSLLRDPVFLASTLFVGWGVTFVVYRELGRSDRGARFFDRMLLNIPLVGELQRSVLLARFSRTLAILLEAAVPQFLALEIVSGALGNREMEAALKRATEALKNGESLSEAMARESIFPALLTSMVAVGEEVGSLSRVLNLVADSFELDIDTSVSRLTVVLEPVMLGIMGIVVGYVLLAVFLPVYGLLEGL